MFNFSQFFVLFLLTSCVDAPGTIETKSASVAPAEIQNADNITEGTRYIFAEYGSARFVAYKDGNGATAQIKNRVIELEVQPYQTTQAEWRAVNTVTGDYFILNTVTGVTIANIEGVYGVFSPDGK